MASKKAESRFVLDCSNSTKSRYREYNPLLDKNLASFFNTRNNQNFLKLKGFINNEGEIIYDPFYKETLRDKKNIIKEKEGSRIKRKEWFKKKRTSFKK